MPDADKARTTGSRRTGEAAAAPPTPPEEQVGGPVVTDVETSQTAATPLSEDDTQGRTKVPMSWALENGQRVLGIPRHELVAALGEDEREELTLNAVRKAWEDWRDKVQNPDVAEEG